MIDKRLRAAIILVNWNGWRDSIECLSSIFGSDAPSCADVFLVDNDSGDGSVERIADWCARPERDSAWRSFEGVRHARVAPIPYRIWTANGQVVPDDPGTQLTLVRSGANLGFAGGNNVGAIAAGVDRYSHFWFLNTDTVIRHDALHQLLRRWEADPRLGIVGSTLIYYGRPGRVQAQGGGSLTLDPLRADHLGDGEPISCLADGAALQASVERRMSYVVGASMLVSAEFFRDIGPMCEDYFLYFEELDWAFRARGKYAMGYAPASVVFHKVGASSAQPHSEFALNLLYRNQLRFVGRFLPEQVSRVTRKLAWELVRCVLRQRWMQARLLYRALRDRHALSVAGNAVPGSRAP
jgi:GT2 family glycosyltransferase